MLAPRSPGDAVELTAEGEELVARVGTTTIGTVEPRIASRLLKLMASGNRYEIFALGLSGQTLRTILRETYRDPSVATVVSFPRQITSRAYLRDRDLLRQRDESDFFLFDEDEEEDTEPVVAESEDDDSAESESEPFGDANQAIEEEDNGG